MRYRSDGEEPGLCRLDDPLVGKLCKLVCETIVEEAQEQMARQKKLLDGWGGKQPKKP